MNFAKFLLAGGRDQEAVALIDHGESISYRRLLELVNLKAKNLNESCGQGHRIILVADNSSFFVVNYLAIILSGNICVPVNPSSTDEAVARILRVCETGLCIVESRYQHKIDALNVTNMNETESGDGQSIDELNFESDPDDVAEIMFTSGSTSEPKGVLLSHRNLISNTNSILQYLNLTEADRALVVLPFYYCYGLSVLHTHLRAAASIVLNNQFMMLKKVIADLQDFRCTGFAGVPSHFQIMLRKSRAFRTAKFPTLRYVTQAGGKLPEPFIREFITLHPDVDFYVMYGQTEATARLSYLPPESLEQKMGSIGKAIPGVTLEVVSEKGEPCSVGEAGQLVAKGENIMLGYVGDNSLTNETVRDGWLHTGDIAYRDTEGFYFVVDRVKAFVKVGGERVSPLEIEETILELSEVSDCSVIGKPDELTGESLHAFVVLNSNGALTERQIKDHCSRELTSSKVPQVVEFLTEMPLNGVGKKLKEVLRELAERSHKS